MKHLLIFLVLLIACSTGTRHGSSGVQVGRFRIIAWINITPSERSLLLETVERHNKLLQQYLTNEHQPDVDIVFTKTLAELNQMRNVVAYSNGGNGPVPIYSQIINNSTGEAFIDIHNRKQIIYIYAGDKLQAHELGHAMMHTIIGELPRTAVRAGGSTYSFINRGGHLDSRWPLFLIDQWLLSLQLEASR